MWRRRNRRRAQRPELVLPAVNWRVVAAAVVMCAVLASVYATGAWLLNRPIERVVIRGSFQRVSAVRVEAMVEPYAHKGFLGIDLGAARREVQALPWVARAEVRRRWPGTLEVRITEETPIACWGESGLLNAAGQLFLPTADHVPAELPRLSGPAGSEAEVTARYFRVQEQLEHRGMSAVAMRLDDRGAWTFQLNNGVQVRLGANGVDARIARFFEVLDLTLSHSLTELEYVDMRYPNGFAVGWKKAGAVQAASSKEPGPNA